MWKKSLINDDYITIILKILEMLMNFLEATLLKLEKFEEKYLKGYFYNALKMDREHQILKEGAVEAKHAIPGMLREMEHSSVVKFIVSLSTAIFIFPILNPIVTTTFNNHELSGLMSLIMSVCFSIQSANLFQRQLIPRLLFKDDERIIKTLFTNNKTKKYWIDHFLDKKEFKLELKNNSTLIFTVLRSLLISYKLDESHKNKLTELLDNWIEKGLTKEVYSNFLEFMVYPENNQIFLNELTRLRSSFLTKEKQDEMLFLLMDSEKILQNKASVSELIGEYEVKLKEKFGPNDISFFKENYQDDKERVIKKLTRVANK